MSTIRPKHPHVEDLKPYQPPDLDAAAERADVAVGKLIRLVANENPFGPSPLVRRALADFDQYHLHPDYGPLKEAVAGYAGMSTSQVVLSNGSDEMIDLLIRLFVEPGEAVVIAPPTFSMYRFSARVNRCDVVAVPREDDLSLNPAAVERAVVGRNARADFEAGVGPARVLFLVSPHNPSGRAMPLELIEKFLALPLVVVVDEAYIEFGGESTLSLLSDHENLVIMRTFSKWAGLAGLRLGYTILAPKLADYLERIRPPYNVNAAAMVAALATFEDLDRVKANVAHIVEERERLVEALRAFAYLEPLPSEANFVLCRVVGRDARGVVDGLLDEGILVRDFSDPAMAGYVRISVGKPEQNEALLEALEAIG